MRFMTYGTYTVPPTPGISPVSASAISFNQIDTAIKWETFVGNSGESGIIVPGGKIYLERLIVGWGGLEIAGRLIIQGGIRQPLCVLFQTTPSGSIAIPFDGMLIDLGNIGLRCANNSVEGEYTVTAYYRECHD